mgnify:CR=1 FL=1
MRYRAYLTVCIALGPGREPTPADKAAFREAVTRRLLDARFEDITCLLYTSDITVRGLGWSLPCQGQWQWRVVLTTGERDADVVKSALKDALTEIQGTIFKVVGDVRNVTIEKLGEDIISDLTSSPDVQWIVLGVGSGLTIGILIFGLIKLLRG